MVDSNAISIQSLEMYFGVRGKRFQQQYRDILSGFKDWDQKSHAQDYLVFPENMGEYLSLDETALSNGELYTILINKAAKGKRGSIVGIFSGTKSDWIIDLIQKHFPKKLRDYVKEVSLDLAASMNMIASMCFRKAKRVADRFHVQRLVCDAVQEIRIRHRWDAIDEDNFAFQDARKKGSAYKPTLLPNGDTKKQLLSRSRFALFKHHSKWTEKQRARTEILFDLYPDLEQAYAYSTSLCEIYQGKYLKQVGLLKLAQWENEVQKSGFKSFSSIARTFHTHYDSISNYFINRSTNASAESFNAKIKEFRRQFRGVTDITFFLFRLTKIYA